MTWRPPPSGSTHCAMRPDVKEKSELVEVPLSAFFFPYVGTTMRILPALTAMQRIGFHLEARLNKKPIVFDIHPNEFIDSLWLL